MSEDRLEVLKRKAESINIHDDNRDLLRLIVEELELLRGRTDVTEQLITAVRRAL